MARVASSVFPKAKALALAGLLGAAASGAVLADVIVWPGATWPTATAAEMDMDEAGLIEARDYAQRVAGSAYITRHGRLVMAWGSDTYPYYLYSASKSFGATALGLAVEDARLALDTQAQLCHPDLGIPPSSNAATGWLDDISILHLATHTAGFPLTGGYGALLFEPGTEWHYSNGGPNWLAECLTLEYGQDLLSLMYARVFTPIGIGTGEVLWRDNAYRPHTINGIPRREFGSGIRATANALARLGYLYLRRGEWDGLRILPESFIDQVRVPVPEAALLPVHDTNQDLPNEPMHYGLLWWNNADGSLANVPRDAYWAWGVYDQIILVIPSLDIVVSRAGYGFQEVSDFAAIEPFFEAIALSVLDVDPLDIPDLVLAHEAGVTELSWSGLGAGAGHDVVQGDLSLLRAEGDFTVATQTCTADDAVQSVEDPFDPPPGSAAWYLVRSVGGTYDTEGPAQTDPRDVVIAASPSSCP